jgi:Domain of unknown function (DUF1707)
MAYPDLRDSDLRASDGERDTVVTELGTHFEAGRLDPAEFDQRIGAAMTARTRGDLAGLLADLPGRQPVSVPPSAASEVPVRARGRRGLAVLLPLVVAAVIASSLTRGSHDHYWFLWPVVAILAVRLGVRGTGRPSARLGLAGVPRRR